VLLVFGASVGNAASVAYENAFSFLTVSFPDQALVFPTFNTSLGTLNSVQLTFLPQGTVDSSDFTAIETAGSLTNTSGSISSGLDIQFHVGFSVDDTDFNNFSFGVFAQLYGPNGVLQASGAGATTTWTDAGTLTKLSADQSQTFNCGTCTRYLSTTGSTVSINGVSATGNYFGFLPASFTQSAVTQGEAVASITYDFTPFDATPEPATFSLIGSSLIGLSLLAHKRLVRR